MFDEIEKKISKITIKKRPIAISVDYRPMYIITLILLILKLSSNKNQATLFKIHFLIWNLKNEKNMNEFILDIGNTQVINVLNWSIEPTVIRAIRYMLSDKLIIKKLDKYILDQNGNNFIDIILLDDSILEREKLFLKALGKQTITDKKLEEQLRNIGI